MIYDVIIIGAGASGLLAALELATKSKLSILLIEQVRRLHDSRNVSNGWFGGSAKSDVHIFSDAGFGGDVLSPKIYNSVLKHLSAHSRGNFKQVRSRLGTREKIKMEDMGFEVYEPHTTIITSDKLIQIENSFQKYLKDRVEIKSNCRVVKVDKTNSLFNVFSETDQVFVGRKVLLALGRGGGNWALDALNAFDLKYINDSYDLGVRLEFPETALKELSTTNFMVRWGDYRTSTFTSRGTVEMENVDEIRTSNARSMTGKLTHSSSMCLLKTFKSDNALQDLTRLVRMANVLADDQLLREPASKLMTGTSVLSPIKEYDSLKDGLAKLFELLPAARKRATLYAPEARLNAIKFDLSEHMQTHIGGLYVIGDMSAKTSSFAQAACSGVIAARHILGKIKKRSKVNVRKSERNN